METNSYFSRIFSMAVVVWRQSGVVVISSISVLMFVKTDTILKWQAKLIALKISHLGDFES